MATAVAVRAEFCQRFEPRSRVPVQGHRCSRECALWEWIGKQVFVCRETLAVHLCGDRCDRGDFAPRNECRVCSLTGLVIGDAPQVHHGKVINERWCDTQNRVGPRVRKVPQAPPALQIVETTVRLLLGPHPAREHARQQAEGQVVLSHTPGGPFLASHEAVWRKALAKGPRLNRPARGPPLARHTKRLAAAIAPHAKKHGVSTVPKLRVFAAVMLEKLRNGVEVMGVKMVPRDPFVVKHLCCDTATGAVLGVQPRQFSAMDRAIAFGMTSGAGVPRPDCMVKVPPLHA